MKRILIILIVTLILLTLLFWVGSIVYCEMLTARYGDEFIKAAEDISQIIKVDRWKILKYTKNYAKVYYICDYGGSVISYVRQNDDWIYLDWEADWSVDGSADDLIWPYIRMPLWGSTGKHRFGVRI